MTQPITAVSAARRSLQIVELAGRFRDERRFLPLCCQCAQYGARWSCPPLNPDPDEFLGRFDAALLFAAQFFFDRSLIETVRAPDAAGRVMSQTADWGKNALARELLLLEARLPGSEALFAGSCGWCGRCARADRKPCVNPDRMRLSVDALSLDVTAVLRELFGIALLWPREGLPDYCTLVGGLLPRGAQPPDDAAAQLEAALGRRLFTQ